MGLGEGMEDKDRCWTTTVIKMKESRAQTQAARKGREEGKEVQGWETTAESTDEEWPSKKSEGCICVCACV